MRYLATLIVILSAATAGAQTTRPAILVGFDAQPIANFARVKALGANALHRYDPGPQKSGKLADWIAAADLAGLYTIVQGAAADAQGVDLATLPPTVVAVAQDDEPDIGRWPTAGTPAQQAEAATWLYAPADAPHPSVAGWTRPQVLADRYARWRGRTTLPVVVNFAGNSINSGWYRPDLIYHRGYIGASDQQGADTYPYNNQGSNGHPYWPANVLDKINAAGGRAVDAYVECSFQGRAGGRGPTPAEQSTLTWSAVAHGARRVWYFTQKTDPPAQFAYWAMAPANEQQAAADIAALLRHADLIAGAAPVLQQTPKVQPDSYKGVLVWPDTERVTWKDKAGNRLQVVINYADGTAPVIDYQPAVTVDSLTRDVADLRTRLAQRDADVAATAAALSAAQADVAAVAAWLNAAPRPATAKPATQPAAGNP